MKQEVFFFSWKDSFGEIHRSTGYGTSEIFAWGDCLSRYKRNTGRVFSFYTKYEVLDYLKDRQENGENTDMIVYEIAEVYNVKFGRPTLVERSDD